MLQTVQPIIETVLYQEAGDDFIEVGLSMLNLLLFKLRKVPQLPGSLLYYFPILCYILGAAPNNVNQQAILNLNLSISRKKLML